MKFKDSESMESGSTTPEESYSESTSQCSSQEVDIADSKKGEIPPENSTPANDSAPTLRSSVNDAVVMKLLKHWKLQCSATEEYALNYITQLHHPAISCFREIRKGDLNNLFNNNKWKRHIVEPVEQSVVYMGIIDYMATAMNNPLYEESFSKSFAKGGLQIIQKIMMDFKSMIANWSLSEKDSVKKRYEAIMRHLRQLVPLFAAAGQDFESVLDCIDSDIVRIKANQERIKTSFPEDVKDSSKISSLESINDDRFALGEIVLNFGPGDDKNKIPVSASSTPVSTSSKNKTKIRPASASKSSSTSKQPSKSKATTSLRQNQKPPNSASTKRPTTDTDSPVNETPTKKIKSEKDNTTPTAADSLVRSDDSKISCPPSKIVEPKSPSLVIGEKKINAFAVLMNKSREIAQANKLKKVAAEAKIAARAVI